jgi:hypothetical protein
VTSRVVAFFRPKRRAADWSQEEIAELYRIEHALIQARFSIETDRGVSDEGDPWFVFCKADGEVLVHITRTDNSYLLYAVGLPRALVGTAIGDLSRSFVSQIPANVPVRPSDGAKLMVHPAATLAVLIGMIIIAHDDAYLLAGDGRTAELPRDNGADGSERTVKGPLPSLYSKFADGLLTALGRGEATGHQEGAYLNIVATIAAAMVGSALVLEAIAEDAGPSLASSEAPTEPAHIQQAVAERADDLAMRVDVGVGDKSAVSAQAEATTIEPPAEQGRSVQALASVVVAGMASDSQPSALATEAHLALDHEKPLSLDFETAFDLPRLPPPAETIYVEAGPAPAAPAAMKPVAPTSTALAATSSHAVDDGTSSSDQLFQNVLKAATLPVTGELKVTMTVASQEILRSIPPVTPPPTATASGTGTVVDVEAPVASPAQGKLYPLFDLAAQDTLVRFLKANPLAQAIFFDNNVVVYDGQKDFGASPVTVQVWEFDTGATIALVGHVNAPDHAVA